MLLPDAMDEDLAEILGMMCFEVGPIAHAMRDGGAAIAPKAEAEQATVIFQLLRLYAEHGAAWRPAAGVWLDGVITEARAARVGCVARAVPC